MSPPLFQSTHVHADLIHVHRWFIVHVGVSQTRLEVTVLIRTTYAQLGVHGITQLYTRSFPYPVGTAKQPTPEMKGTYYSSHFPSCLRYSLESFLFTRASMAPGPSRCCWCVPPSAECAGSLVPHLLSSGWPMHTIADAGFISVCNTQIPSRTWGNLFQQLWASQWEWKCF